MKEKDYHTTANRARLLSSLRVQYPDTLAERGSQLLDPTSGGAYTDHCRHLVATCRSIANFAVGAIVNDPNLCLSVVEHGLSFLEQGHHTDEGNQLIVNTSGTPPYKTRSAYGHDRGSAGLWYKKRLPTDDDDGLVGPDPPGVETDCHRECLL